MKARTRGRCPLSRRRATPKPLRAPEPSPPLGPQTTAPLHKRCARGSAARGSPHWSRRRPRRGRHGDTRESRARCIAPPCQRTRTGRVARPDFAPHRRRDVARVGGAPDVVRGRALAACLVLRSSSSSRVNPRPNILATSPLATRCRSLTCRGASSSGLPAGSIPRAAATLCPPDGTHLQRYSRCFSCAEINSSVYPPHASTTYARWAASTPAHFRFPVEVSNGPLRTN